ncbi:MAG TPA: ABC transporter permease [Egicoccus sp.]|nr:ABC transporter permease [Egicoccus sp.]HSK24842.1 ABC transporter permease [Egicoccus sp.]
MSDHSPPPPAEPGEPLDDEVKAAAERDQVTPTATLDASVSQRLVRAVTGASVLTTLLAIFSALVVGALVIVLSDEATREALGYFTSRPSDTFSAAWSAVGGAYWALLRGSVGGVGQISETLVAATPLILTGLAVAIPLRAGLFNIGAEGQLIAGGLAAALVGFSFDGLPLVVHLPLAVLAGIVGGFAYGWLPGILKARTGAHEVITTIMLNNIAILGTNFLLTTALFRRPDRTDPISKSVADAAELPRLPFLTGQRVNYGLLLAILAAVVMFWFLERSTRGFEINAVGQNPIAATVAGMNPRKAVILAMALGGALAGAGGAAEILGIHQRITPGFSAGLGFDGITVALLGRGGVGGTVAAGLLFGALRSGGRTMQASTGTSLDLVVVIQALIIVFIAAPGLVRAIYRIRTADTGTGQIAKGWGS